jgi:molecular chaperone DnaK
MSESLVVAIDFGTARSAVGYMAHGFQVVVSATTNRYSFPSEICHDDEFVFGDAAVSYSQQGWGVVSDVKRAVGRKLDDPKVKEWSEYWPFPLGSNSQNEVTMHLGSNSEEFTPEELVPEIVKSLVRIASDACGWSVTGVVVTVPSCLGDGEAERFATIVKRGCLGLLISTIDNLTVIGRAYAHHVRERGSGTGRRTIFVVDAGAGKIDAGVLRVENDDVEIISKEGNRELGGRDFDFGLASSLTDRLTKRGIGTLDAAGQARVRCALLERCRLAREVLSTAETTEIDLRFRELPELPDSKLSVLVRRSTLKWLKFNELVQEIEAIVRALLTKTKPLQNEIDDVVLVGGACEMPFLREIILGCVKWKKGTFPVKQLAIHGAILEAARKSEELAVKDARDRLAMSDAAVARDSCRRCCRVRRTTHPPKCRSTPSCGSVPSHCTGRGESAPLGKSTARTRDCPALPSLHSDRSREKTPDSRLPSEEWF